MVRLPAAKRDDKGMRAFVLAIANQLGEGNTNGTRFGSTSDPELHGFFGRRVYHELVIVLIVSGCRQNTSNIASMANFCQSEAADILSILKSLKPRLVPLSP